MKDSPLTEFLIKLSATLVLVCALSCVILLMINTDTARALIPLYGAGFFLCTTIALLIWAD